MVGTNLENREQAGDRDKNIRKKLINFTDYLNSYNQVGNYRDAKLIFKEYLSNGQKHFYHMEIDKLVSYQPKKVILFSFLKCPFLGYTKS